MVLDHDVVLRLDRSRDYLVANQCRPISLYEAAREAYFSPYHYHRLFSELFGETPLELLTRNRVENARKLLLESDLSVTEVCLKVGYQSLGTFSSRFRCATGRTPSEFREQSRRYFELGQLWTYKFVPHCFVRHPSVSF